MSAGGVLVARPDDHRAGGGSSPTSALHHLHNGDDVDHNLHHRVDRHHRHGHSGDVRDVRLRPIPFPVAKHLLVRHHYLGSLAGGTRLALGAFAGQHLMGAITLGAGPYNAGSLVENAAGNDSLTLTRLWLSEQLPRNSESRVLGVVIRSLRRYTAVKFVLAYADPSEGHLGSIYQASTLYNTSARKFATRYMHPMSKTSPAQGIGLST